MQGKSRRRDRTMQEESEKGQEKAGKSRRRGRPLQGRVEGEDNAGKSIRGKTRQCREE